MRDDDPRIKSLMSEGLARALSPPPSADTELQVKTTCDSILRLYDLHTKYSKLYKYDDGLVGPPYVVYRISTTNATRVFYGHGLATSDEEFLGVLIFLIVLILIVGVLIFAFQA